MSARWPTAISPRSVHPISRAGLVEAATHRLLERNAARSTTLRIDCVHRHRAAGQRAVGEAGRAVAHLDADVADRRRARHATASVTSTMRSAGLARNASCNAVGWTWTRSAISPTVRRSSTSATDARPGSRWCTPDMPLNRWVAIVAPAPIADSTRGGRRRAVAERHHDVALDEQRDRLLGARAARARSSRGARSSRQRGRASRDRSARAAHGGCAPGAPPRNGPSRWAPMMLRPPALAAISCAVGDPIEAVARSDRAAR